MFTVLSDLSPFSSESPHGSQLNELFVFGLNFLYCLVQEHRTGGVGGLSLLVLKEWLRVCVCIPLLTPCPGWHSSLMRLALLSSHTNTRTNGYCVLMCPSWEKKDRNSWHDVWKHSTCLNHIFFLKITNLMMSQKFPNTHENQKWRVETKTLQVQWWFCGSVWEWKSMKTWEHENMNYPVVVHLLYQLAQEFSLETLTTSWGVLRTSPGPTTCRQTCSLTSLINKR